LLTYYYYGYPKAIQAAISFFVTLPIVGIASIRLSDLAFDVSKSIRPLIVSIGNVMSSSEPLRELRAELQAKIRLMVEEMGPEIFEDFEEIRVVKKEDIIEESGEFEEIAKKLHRSRKLTSPSLSQVDNDPQGNAFFSAELDKVRFDF
jgi:glycerol-3-phosphate O-acyltransferase / dihydroxyacetone phosphate acyltransferase